MAQFPNQFPPQQQQWAPQPQQAPQQQQWAPPPQQQQQAPQPQWAPQQQPPPQQQQQWAQPPQQQQWAPQPQQQPQWAPPPQQQQQQPQPQPQWAPPPQQAPQPQQQAPQGGGMKLAPALGPQAYTFDLNDPATAYQDREGFELPPPGRYKLEIVSMTPTANKSGEPQVATQYKIIEGPYQGRVFTCFYSIRKFSDRLRGALDAVFGEGQGWDRATGAFGDRIPLAAGRRLEATMTVRTYTSSDGQEKEAADVRGHKPI